MACFDAPRGSRRLKENRSELAVSQAFHLENEQIKSLLSIKSVEEKLPSNKFVRIHRSFIIAPDKIQEIERNTILINDQRLTVGTNYREVFKEIIDKSRVG